ncbi:hypothetical protein FRAHR75_120001 [Frankia sp. Hr75.2]|nr:hypothetical protein FRAHR75_120001 [Frankia sp. Hr75.2]
MLAVAFGIPLGAAVAAWLALRRVQVSLLGVRQQVAPAGATLHGDVLGIEDSWAQVVAAERGHRRVDDQKGAAAVHAAQRRTGTAGGDVEVPVGPGRDAAAGHIFVR